MKLALITALSALLAVGGCGREAGAPQTELQAGGEGDAAPSAADAAGSASGAARPAAPAAEAGAAGEDNLSALERRCHSAHDAAACLTAAEIYRDRSGEDLDEAFPLYARACELGEPSGAGCVGAGDYYLYKSFSSTHATEENVGKALGYYRGVCDLDSDQASADACLALGNLHAERERRYAYQHFLTLDAELAFRYLDKACSLDSDLGCLFAGDMLSIGDGVTQDQQRAQLLYHKSCALGNPDACAKAGGEPGP